MALGERLSALAGDESDETPAARGFGDEVIALPNATEAAIFMRLCIHFEALPHTSLVLQCSAATTDEEVEQFFRRTWHFPHLKFAIVAPNALTPKARATFLRGHNKRYMAWRQQSSAGQSSVLILFTGKEGLDVMHVADRGGVHAAVTAEKAVVQMMRDSLAKSCLSSLEWVTSDKPRVGKSYYIKSQVRGSRYVRVQVQEGFDGAYLFSRMRNLGTGAENVVLHFDLCFRPELWGPFNTVLNDLIAHSVIIDTVTAELVSFKPRSVRVYVEVPDVGLEDSERKTHLPFSVLGSSVVVTMARHPLLFFHDEEKKKVARVAAFVSLRQQNQVVADAVRKLPVLAEDAAVRLVMQHLDSLGCLQRDRGFEVAFIRMMDERCQHLIKFGSDENNPLRLDKTYMNLLFDAFSLEVVGLLSRDRSSSFGKCIIVCSRAAEAPKFSIFFTPAVAEDPSSRPRWLASFDGCRQHQPTSWVNVSQTDLFSAFEQALGLPSTVRVQPILRRKEFVLTPDSAAKLIALNERRRAREDVVIVGETGVGKVFGRNHVILQRSPRRSGSSRSCSTCREDTFPTRMR